MSGAGSTLASLTSFVGRRGDLASLGEQVRASRLVTVTGPGGVGKTRTATVTADRLRSTFADGVHVVELASVTDATQLAPTAATALGVADQSNRAAVERIITHLSGRDTLLLLDNCEHLLEACGRFVTTLLEELPGLRVIATSREPLGLSAEQVHLLGPLAVPTETDISSGGSLDHVPAVQLFRDRGRSAVPDFEVCAHNRDAVAQLCRRLDGMPLAIELAAVRLRSLSVAQIVERLDHRFQLLSAGNRDSDPRQRSLRALIDWSHELCDDDERLLWARLSVFPAAADLESIEDVCGFGALADHRLLEAVDGLVSKSVITVERRHEQVRYSQFVTLREYGAELLEQSGEAETLHRRHRDHYTRRASHMVDRWCGPHQAEDLARLRDDHPNLLVALAWSVETPGEARPGAHLASLLRYHWIAGGFLTYGRRWLERLLDRLDPDVPERGHALWVAAWVALIQGDRNVARRYLGECGRLADRLDDHAMRGHTAHWRALLNLFEGDLLPAIVLYDQAISWHRSVGDLGAELTAGYQLAMAQTYAGRTEEALRTCHDVDVRGLEHGELWARGYAFWVRAICQVHLGDRIAAREAIRVTMDIEREFRDGVCTALTTEVASWVAASYGHFENAAALAGAAGAVWRQLGTNLAAFGPHASADGRAHGARIDDQLGPDRADAIRAQHANVSVTEAVTLGIRLADKAGEPAPPRNAVGRASAGPENLLLRGGLAAAAAGADAGTGENLTAGPAATRSAASDGVAPAGRRPSRHAVPKRPVPERAVLGDSACTPEVALTRREQQVAALIADGKSNKEIAESLTISHRTVDGHVERLLRKLDVASRTQIASWFATLPR
ncbi:LuxR C-terminal-related transcriptional regulator [Prauserella alba]|uniref:HTH luxR-type domain-containing protein n=1 Tax=Prauserella alba TaxID=176898 RepID=A0ABP4G536_9PSEU|nr:LuxR C-terminal-related transcriptional regulator [Prauserella alba]MCP2182144.1 putative ATPase [Prauserella alba]